MNIARLTFLFLFLPSLIFAQLGDFVVINKIFLQGNKRTVDRIIFREVDIQKGDTIISSQIDTVLKINRNRIYNTRLFNEVTLTLLPDSSHRQNLLIEVTERWYIFPIPIFELADRSFNEWWYNQNRDLNRINYGIRFSDKNFRGRKEELGLTVQGGFTKKLELSYNIPYLNKNQTWGMDLDVGYDQGKQTAYETKLNKQQFLKLEEVVRERYKIGLSLLYRKYFFGTHAFDIHYHYAQVPDTVIKLNPHFFQKGQRQQKFLQLSYYFTFDKRDVRAYAQKGHYVKFSFEQKGITQWDDIRVSIVDLTFGKYFPLSHNFFLASLSKAKVYISKDVPYYNIRSLGYDQDYVRGYDLYVIDAQCFLLQRMTLRKKLLERDLYLDSFLPVKQFNKVPLALYLNTYYDLGYGYSDTPQTGNEYLANEWLRGGGIGLDLVSYYDSVIRFEYSFNKMLEHRVYIAFTSDI